MYIGRWSLKASPKMSLDPRSEERGLRAIAGQYGVKIEEGGGTGRGGSNDGSHNSGST